MTKEAQDADSELPENSGTNAPPKKKSRKLIFIAAAGVVLIAASAAGVYFSGILGGGNSENHHTDDASAEKPATPSEPTFFAVPDMVVSLNTTERRPIYLKVKISLELANASDKPRIDRLMPRVLDACQMFLRELRVDDLRGSAGTLLVREELLRRVSAELAPIEVRNVLLTDMIIQ